MGSARQMEIQQHRLGVGREQDIGRLQVHVDQPSLVGILQRVGQAGDLPADRANVRRLREKPPRRARGGLRPGVGLPGPVEQLEQGPSAALVRRNAAQLGEDPSQGRPAQVRHAKRTQPAGRKLVLAVQGHDVGVLQACQREVFDMVVGSDLEHDLAVRERRLSRQETAPARSLTELGQEEEIAQRLAWGRKGRRARRGRQQTVAVENDGELGLPLGEPPDQLRKRDFLTLALPQADFLVDQSNRCAGLFRQPGMTLEEQLGPQSFSSGPGGSELFDHARDRTGLSAAGCRA